MTRTLIPMLCIPLLFAGCDLIQDGKDLVDGLTNPLVTQALVLGVELPEDAQGIEFPTEFSDGAGISVFLADAADVADMANAPIDGAQITVQEVSVPGVGEGAYLLEPNDLAYDDGATWVLQVDLNSEVATANVELAPAANANIPQTIKVGASMDIDLTGKGFDGALVAVVNQDGDVTYDNRPQDIKGLYDLTRGGDVELVTIPATAFSAPGVYAVGVAGLRTTKGASNMESMNTVLSTVISGKMKFGGLIATP